MILQTLAGMRVRQRAAALPRNQALAALNALISMPPDDPDWDAAWERATAAVSAWKDEGQP